MGLEARGYHSWTEGNYQSSNDEKNFFWVFLQICDPYFNKTKSTGENAFNGDHLGTEGNHESCNDKKNFLKVFLQICDSSFSP